MHFCYSNACHRNSTGVQHQVLAQTWGSYWHQLHCNALYLQSSLDNQLLDSECWEEYYSRLAKLSPSTSKAAGVARVLDWMWRPRKALSCCLKRLCLIQPSDVIGSKHQRLTQFYYEGC